MFQNSLRHNFIWTAIAFSLVYVYEDRMERNEKHWNPIKMLTSRYKYCKDERSTSASCGTLVISLWFRFSRCNVRRCWKLPGPRLSWSLLWLKSRLSSEFMDGQNLVGSSSTTLCDKSRWETDIGNWKSVCRLFPLWENGNSGFRESFGKFRKTICTEFGKVFLWNTANFEGIGNKPQHQRFAEYTRTSAKVKSNPEED